VKYLIQIFRPSSPGSNVGSWHNTAWGSDDYDKTMKTVEDIANNNRMGILKVRMLKVLKEIDCEGAGHTEDGGGEPGDSGLQPLPE
jgi:hypothetical protein